MSDCFDHELDAWESYDQEQDYSPHRKARGYSDRDDFIKDPLYYYDLVYFEEKVHETDKALLLTVHGNDVWIPKALCKFLGAETVWVQKQFIRGKIK